MTYTAVATALWRFFKWILRILGGWIAKKFKKEFGSVREIRVKAGYAMSIYLRGRAERFAEKRGRSRSKRRRKWLARRAQRYLKAARWFKDRADDLSEQVAQTWLERTIEEKIPYFSKEEDYRRWAT